MAIEIKETFTVAAPIDRVWQFLLDPRQVVTCIPGGKLDEVVDESTFLGTVKIKVGAMNARYKGRISFSRVDAQTHEIEMVAEGREPGGGTARATVSSRLRSVEGGTEVVSEAGIELTGRMLQMGRGMIQGVSHELFLRFVRGTAEKLERGPESPQADDSGGVAASTPAEAEPPAVRIVPIVLRTLWQGIVGFFQRLFGGGRG